MNFYIEIKKVFGIFKNLINKKGIGWFSTNYINNINIHKSIKIELRYKIKSRKSSKSK